MNSCLPVIHSSSPLPPEVREQVQDILERILKLAGYSLNSNSGSNPDGVTKAKSLRNLRNFL